MQSESNVADICSKNESADANRAIPRTAAAGVSHVKKSSEVSRAGFAGSERATGKSNTAFRDIRALNEYRILPHWQPHPHRTGDFIAKSPTDANLQLDRLQ